MNSENRQYWIFGKHSVTSCLMNKNRTTFKIVLTNSDHEAYSLAHKSNIPIEIVSESWFANKFPNQVHQKTAALVEKCDLPSLEEVLSSGKNLLILDLITDPHNIGAILRSAAVFGIGAVIMQDKGSPNKDNDIISKTSSGAVELVPLLKETNLTRTIEKIKKHDYWCVSLTEHRSQPLNKIDLSGKIALIIGSEGNGIRRLILENSDFLAHIPNTNQNFSTLNAAQAATVGMYELSKYNKN